MRKKWCAGTQRLAYTRNLISAIGCSLDSDFFNDKLNKGVGAAQGTT